MNHHLLLLLFGASVGVTCAGILWLSTRCSCGVRPRPPETERRPYAKPRVISEVPQMMTVVSDGQIEGHVEVLGLTDDQVDGVLRERARRAATWKEKGSAK